MSTPTWAKLPSPLVQAALLLALMVVMAVLASVTRVAMASVAFAHLHGAGPHIADGGCVVTEAGRLVVLVPPALVLPQQLAAVAYLADLMAELLKAHQLHAVGGERDLPSQERQLELNLEVSLPLQPFVRVQKNFQMQKVGRQQLLQPHVRIAASAQLLAVNVPPLGSPPAGALLLHQAMAPVHPMASDLLWW